MVFNLCDAGDVMLVIEDPDLYDDWKTDHGTVVQEGVLGGTVYLRKLDDIWGTPKVKTVVSVTAKEPYKDWTWMTDGATTVPLIWIKHEFRGMIE